MKELLDLIKDPDLKDFMDKAKSETSFDDIFGELNKLNPWKATRREMFAEKLESCFSKREGTLEELLRELPGIAEKDKDVFIPLLAKNITENIERVFPHNKTKTDETLYKKVLIALMICLPFMDYQQAFDGNLYDPRVIILGINPRFKADTFYDYEQKEGKDFMVSHMKEVYDKPICEKNRPMLYKRDKNCPMPYKMNETDDENGEKIKNTDLHIAEDDYYYGRHGKFYPKVSDNLLKEEHRSRCLGTEEKQDNDEKPDNEEKQNNEGKTDEKKNPVAFLELFPYASNDIGTWWDQEDLNHAFRLLKWDEAVYKDLKVWATSNMNRISQISKPIGDKIELESDELLYSQQWILCLLYCILIKNRKSKEHDKWFVISTKNKEDHLKRLEAFINATIKIEENPNFCFLTTSSPRQRSLGPNNLFVVEKGVKSEKINNPNTELFWNTSDTSASQNATGSTKDQKNETLNNQAFRRLWGIDE